MKGLDIEELKEFSKFTMDALALGCDVRQMIGLANQGNPDHARILWEKEERKISVSRNPWRKEIAVEFEDKKWTRKFTLPQAFNWEKTDEAKDNIAPRSKHFIYFAIWKEPNRIVKEWAARSGAKATLENNYWVIECTEQQDDALKELLGANTDDTLDETVTEKVRKRFAEKP